jgi:hypothetical protein
MWKKSQPAAPVAPKPRAKWHAVSVSSDAGSCFRARELKGQRFLSAEAPALPLPDCTQPAICNCSYRKYDDRRAGPRRSREVSAIQHPTASPEQRKIRGRRARDQEK